jgi:zinc transport system substrate-binding protein
MKRFTAMLLVLLLAATALPACEKSGADEKISIVCTIFPQYDWVRQILGENAANMETTLLLKNRIDLHNYQPSVDDIVKISGCDLFIYVGGESDAWVADILKRAVSKNMIVINLLDILGDAAKEEEIKLGMEAENNDEAEYDEHVWLSLKNAKLFGTAIADVLSLLDSGNAEAYQSNLGAYVKKLDDLDAKYQAAAGFAPVKTLLFGDRFPFRYLADDCDLDYYAAFTGCSAETEASFETIIFLARKIDELNLKTVMVTETSDKKIAQTIIENTKNKTQRILVLNAMQSVMSDDISNGATYLSIMESNLEVLKEALN